VENDLLPSVITIYHTKKYTDPAMSAYTTGDLLGHGLVLTANGWILTSREVLAGLKEGYTAVGYQSKKYSLANLLEDRAGRLVFAKISASNLPVVRLGKSSDLQLGQSVVVVGSRDQLVVTTIAKIGYNFLQSKDLVLNSDYFGKRIYLAQKLDGSFEGAALVNFKGEVIGIISGGSAMPVDYFSNIIPQVLSKQQIVRAAMGVDYIDLAQVDGLVDLSDKGAYVVYEPLKSSAAYGKIKKGDIIRKVNDQELNVFVGLADAINNYHMGDRVELLLSRGGKDMTVDVVLK
jgi:serine protease Do